MARASLDLIEAMYAAAEAAQPITGRGIGYKLFTQGLIPSMATGEMAKVYRLLRLAREQGRIPWEWIVDETRDLERRQSWRDRDAFIRTVRQAYRRDFWAQQPKRVEVWSEKGTVRGVLAPVLDEYGVGFRVMHGFSSATAVHDVAQGGDGRLLVVLYVGDCDPSGMHMSERDLPERLEEYGGESYHSIAGCSCARAIARPLTIPGVRQKERPPLQMVHWQVRGSMLGVGCDGSARPSRHRGGGDQGADRSDRLGTLRHCGEGRAGIIQTALDGWNAGRAEWGLSD